MSPVPGVYKSVGSDSHARALAHNGGAPSRKLLHAPLRPSRLCAPGTADWKAIKKHGIIDKILDFFLWEIGFKVFWLKTLFVVIRSIS